MKNADIGVLDELVESDFSVIDSGTYYVKSFHVGAHCPAKYSPLRRDGLLRFCLKPPQA